MFENGHQSAEFKEILREIFSRFDSDNDGYLNYTEMKEYVLITNNAPLSKQFYESMVRKYHSRHDCLSLKGFNEFYLDQTLDDPLETIRDLNLHGFDNIQIE